MIDTIIETAKLAMTIIVCNIVLIAAVIAIVWYFQ